MSATHRAEIVRPGSGSAPLDPRQDRGHSTAPRRVALAAGIIGIAMLVAPGSTGRYFSWELNPPALAALVGVCYVVVGTRVRLGAWQRALDRRSAGCASPCSARPARPSSLRRRRDCRRRSLPGRRLSRCHHRRACVRQPLHRRPLTGGRLRRPARVVPAGLSVALGTRRRWCCGHGPVRPPTTARWPPARSVCASSDPGRRSSPWPPPTWPRTPVGRRPDCPSPRSSPSRSASSARPSVTSKRCNAARRPGCTRPPSLCSRASGQP